MEEDEGSRNTKLGLWEKRVWYKRQGGPKPTLTWITSFDLVQSRKQHLTHWPLAGITAGAHPYFGHSHLSARQEPRRNFLKMSNKSFCHRVALTERQEAVLPAGELNEQDHLPELLGLQQPHVPLSSRFPAQRSTPQCQ